MISNKLLNYLILNRSQLFFKNVMLGDEKYYKNNTRVVKKTDFDKYYSIINANPGYKEADAKIAEWKKSNIDLFNETKRIPTVVTNTIIEKNITSDQAKLGYKYVTEMLNTTDWSDICTDICLKIKPEHENDYIDAKRDIYKELSLEDPKKIIKELTTEVEVTKKRLSIDRTKIKDEPDFFKDYVESIKKYLICETAEQNARFFK